MSMDVRFKHPFACNIGGRTVSSKSNICVQFLEKLKFLFTEQRF